jgi:hypothetical protein
VGTGDCFPEVKPLGHEVDHLTPSSVKVKNYAAVPPLPYTIMKWNFSRKKERPTLQGETNTVMINFSIMHLLNVKYLKNFICYYTNYLPELFIW